MTFFIIIVVVIIVLYFIIRSQKPHLSHSEMKIIGKLLQKCDYYIEQFEKGKLPSCKDDLHEAIMNLLFSRRNEFKEWDGSEDYDKIAQMLIAQVSFDLLASGKYHIYTGVLNPVGCGESMKIVYTNCMKAAVDNGDIDMNTYDEQLKLLEDKISFVG